MEHVKRVFVLLATGFETIEAIAPVDILRRCGIDVKISSITESLMVRSSQEVNIRADTTIGDEEIDTGDMLVLPGGYPGYDNLAKSSGVGQLLKSYYSSGRMVAAICGAPTVLAKYGIARGSNVTCHSSVVAVMADYNYVGGNVVRDGNLITGVGAGHSIEFGLTLAGALVDENTVKKVALGMELV